MNVNVNNSIPSELPALAARSARNGKRRAIDAPVNGNVDSLLVAIDAYRLGCVEFCKLPDDDPEDEEAAIAATYGPPMEVLEEWDRPARSREAVVAALELLKSEQLVVGDMGNALLDACLLGLKEGAL
ncbi:hypothetical protein [Rhizobium lentis]|uniref:hypothetical protein n=1 Tax=Rhizobium lentis TaxID=1138194 RepID=UPI001C8343E5|nr:hypothetical protein [Rhizobium lentis]MBX5008156.1 hypothetical protein [Rhizobium lentis]